LKIAVIGLGNFGTNVAKALYERGHDLLAMDIKEARAQSIQEHSSKSVAGDCSRKEVLEDLGLATFDVAIISVGTNMSGSILAAMYLKEMKVERIIVKAISDDHKKILDKIGVTEVIFPEREMAVKLARNITTPNLLDYLPLSEDFSIMEIIPPEEFIGESLSELDLRKKYEIQVIGINDTHADKVELLVSPGHVIKQTDRLLILGTQKSLNKIKQLKGFQ